MLCDVLYVRAEEQPEIEDLKALSLAGKLKLADSLFSSLERPMDSVIEAVQQCRYGKNLNSAGYSASSAGNRTSNW
jgi:hypothetical protein